jgi:hypothetical protein
LKYAVSRDLPVIVGHGAGCFAAKPKGLASNRRFSQALHWGLLLICPLLNGKHPAAAGSPEAPRAHWSFSPPAVTAVPARPSVQPASDRIDAFLAPSWERSGLEPQPPAPPDVWLRRVTLALTGLPPDSIAMQRFLSDRQPTARQRVIDRLLADPRHGEHIARPWLDLIRYADTHGLNYDNYREVWPYRDWVIAACNAGIPFDQFVRHQLAGDLLPQPTRESLVATAMMRMHPSTNETGSIIDDVRLRYERERTETFGTAFMGLTVHCAACHDHKYDPLTMADFYALAGFFNGLAGPVLDANVAAPEPSLALPSSDQQTQQSELRLALADLDQARLAPHETLDWQQAAWEQHLRGAPQPPARWRALRSTDNEAEFMDQPLARFRPRPVHASFLLPTDSPWRQLELELARPPATTELREEDLWIEEVELLLRPEADATWLRIRSDYAAVQAEISHDGGAIIDGQREPEQGVRVRWRADESLKLRCSVTDIESLNVGAELRVTLHLRLAGSPSSQREPPLPIRISAKVASEPLRLTTFRQLRCGDWYLLGPLAIENAYAGYVREVDAQRTPFDPRQTFIDDGRSLAWQRLERPIDGQCTELPNRGLETSTSLLYRFIESPEAQPIEIAIGSQDGVQVYLNSEILTVIEGPRDHRWCGDTVRGNLRSGANHLLIKHINHGGAGSISVLLCGPLAPPPPSVLALAGMVESERTTEQRQQLRRYFRRAVCRDIAARRWDVQEKLLLEELDRLEDSVARLSIWRERNDQRPAYVYAGGQYDQPDQQVPRRTPSFLPPLAYQQAASRLDLAHWLTDPQHPLTARVVVNRYWQMVFGAGIVRTPEDFGTQGAQPTHPQLLDWLAITLIEDGWDTKRLHRDLIRSAAFGRAATAPALAWEQDPENRWLARGPRYRLDAEVLRDQSLLVGGLLSSRVGGPSVYPPQPRGLWEAVGQVTSNTQYYVADNGEATVRRGLYTFWKRTSPPAILAIGDAPSREACTARRERTNTALQALALLHDPQHAVAALGLAEHAYGSATNDRDRLVTAWRTVLCREPDPSELENLLRLLTDLSQAGEVPSDLGRPVDPMAGLDLPLPDAIPPDRKTAWQLVAQMILNLDEALNL